MATGLIIGLALMTACSSPETAWVEPATDRLGCKDYQSIDVGSGILYNNVWNKAAAKDDAWSQCLVQKPDGSAVGWQWDWPETGRQIFAYPQIKRGSSPWDPLPKIDARFPVKVDDLESLQVRHSLDVRSTGPFNVATSFWLTDTAEVGHKPNSDIITAEVMVWTYATKGHMNPAGRKLGFLTDNTNQKWSVWLDEDWGDASGENANRWVILTFKSESPRLSAAFDLATLLADPRLAYLNLSDSYVADVELGTEIMTGQGIAWVEQFDVDVFRQTP